MVKAVRRRLEPNELFAIVLAAYRFQLQMAPDLHGQA
jgi:hypothetical protein